MKTAILKRDVIFKDGKVLPKGRKVFIAQRNERECLVRLSQGHTIEYPIQNTALKFVEEIKVKIHVKRQPRRNDSMFYFGKHIATVSKGKRKVIVESAGEMRAYFKENGDSFLNEKLAKELKSRKTTDRGLSTLGSNDMITLNNWFQITDEATGGEAEIAHTYDDAIALAKNILEQ